MKIHPRGVKYFHANRESKEANDGETEEMKLVFTLQLGESAYKINSAVRSKL